MSQGKVDILKRRSVNSNDNSGEKVNGSDRETVSSFKLNSYERKDFGVNNGLLYEVLSPIHVKLEYYLVRE